MHLFFQINAKFKLLQTNVSNLFEKIRRNDILIIEQKRIEFDNHGLNYHKYITFRTTNESFNKDLVKKALNLLLGSDTSTHEQNKLCLIHCQKLVARSTNGEDCLQHEQELGDILMYYSQSLIGNFPKGFPGELLSDSTSSD